MPAAALKPFRHNGFSRADVRAHVDIDDLIPGGFVIAEAGLSDDAGIGDVDIHGAELSTCGIEQRCNTVRTRGIRGHRDPTDHRRRLSSRFRVNVTDHHRRTG